MKKIDVYLILLAVAVGAVIMVQFGHDSRISGDVRSNAQSKRSEALSARRAVKPSTAVAKSDKMKRLDAERAQAEALLDGLIGDINKLGKMSGEITTKVLIPMAKDDLKQLEKR